MRKRFYLVLVALLGLGLLAVAALAEEPRPAGYIMAYELKGADAEKGTAVVRNGKELAPKLLMPLYDDDSVFIRDEASSITLSLGKEGNLVVSGKRMRKVISGEMTSGDSGFSLIEQIFAILFGHGDDDSLSVLVAKGIDEMKAPMAAPGRNYVLRGAAPLRVTWAGGEGPFTVTVAGGKATTQTDRVVEIPAATLAAPKFTVTVKDVRQRKLRIAFETRKTQPKVPQAVKARDEKGEVAAVWLAAQKGGAWRFEAVRQLAALPPNEVTKGLIAALEKGWLPK